VPASFVGEGGDDWVGACFQFNSKYSLFFMQKLPIVWAKLGGYFITTLKQ
jgi:hypothetical protein